MWPNSLGGGICPSSLVIHLLWWRRSLRFTSWNVPTIAQDHENEIANSCRVTGLSLQDSSHLQEQELAGVTYPIMPWNSSGSPRMSWNTWLGSGMSGIPNSPSWLHDPIWDKQKILEGWAGMIVHCIAPWETVTKAGGTKGTGNGGSHCPVGERDVKGKWEKNMKGILWQRKNILKSHFHLFVVWRGLAKMKQIFFLKVRESFGHD